MAATDAEDVFQEVFARLYERLDTLQEDAAVRGWIAQTTRRLAVDRYRASAREGPAAGELPEIAEIDAQLDRLDQALDVHRALGAIPEHCRDVVTRFFIRDQSYAVIAEALDLASGTIASRISRCLGKLRDHLDEQAATSG
jgi:RNA polymerase sigma-70 factor (ECF subfamily)